MLTRVHIEADKVYYYQMGNNSGSWINESLQSFLKQAQDWLPYISFLALVFPAQLIFKFVLNSEYRSCSGIYSNNYSSVRDQLMGFHATK